ncbi:MAG: hypothetical protein AB7N70_32210 [Dehalococcoidia bacterium]
MRAIAPDYRRGTAAMKSRNFSAARVSHAKAVRRPDFLSAGWVLALTVLSTGLAVYDLCLLANLMFK